MISGLGLVGEYVAHRVGGALGGCVVVVGVPLQGKGGGGVAGEGLEVSDGLAALGQQRQAAVPKVVEADGGEACPLQERLVVAIDDVLCVERLTLAGREDEPLILVQRTDGKLYLKLSFAVNSEGVHGPLRKPYGSLRGVLRLGESEAATASYALYLAAHPEGSGFEVYVLPPERERLALTEPAQ